MYSPAAILHPTDFSRSAEKAFRLAETLAASRNAHLVVLHVLPRKGSVVCFGKAQAQTSKEEDQDLTLDSLRQRCPTQYLVAVEHRIAQGDVVAEILRHAQETRAELIVMGSRGRTGLKRLALGSVADRVLCQARCPVVTVSIPTVCRWTPAGRGVREDGTWEEQRNGSPTESSIDGAMYDARFGMSHSDGAAGKYVATPVGKADP